MDLKQVLSKPRIRITLTQGDNYSSYLNARIIRLDKLESRIKRMKKQSKSNVGYIPRIKILKPSFIHTTKNIRRNESTKTPFSKSRTDRKRRRHSVENKMNRNHLDFSTNKSDYQILRNAEEQARSIKNLNQNYEQIKSEIIRDGSSHWIGSKNINISQSNNKLTEIALFKILNKRSIFSKFLFNILPIKKLNQNNQQICLSKYNKRKKSKKKRPRHKNSMEKFIHKYILNKKPCEMDKTHINKFEALISTNSQSKVNKTCATSPSQTKFNSKNLVHDSLSKRKSESYALNKQFEIGKTKSEEIYLPLSSLINKAKNINRNAFDLIQTTLKKTNSAANNDKIVQKFEKSYKLKRYHLISLSDLNMASYQNHNFNGNCSKCDDILNDLLSSNQKLISDKSNSEEILSNLMDISTGYLISDCLPDVESKDDKTSRSLKHKQNDDLKIDSICDNGYKTLNAQVGVPILQKITKSDCFHKFDRTSTSLIDVLDKKALKVSSSFEDESTNNSNIYTTSILDYETYKSNRYMMVHCNDCDLICIVQPIEN